VSGRPQVAGPSQPAQHSGRRSGAPPTRERILTEARGLFAERGFERTTIRAVAGAAGVDPALVMHYFSSKEHLFEAALVPPVSPAALIPGIASGDRGGIGERIARAMFTIWEEPATREAYIALIRCAASNERAAGIVRDFISREVFATIVRTVGVPDAELRASLIGSQIFGLAVARYILRLEPLVQASVDEVVAAVAPTLQRYIIGDIGHGAPVGP
jgi:AcrR family transcriptional regulator